jgi:undecaprenyl-diphosphatase
MHSPSRPLAASQAAVLGALHGPAELLPISSSAHVAIVPWLLKWDYVELDPELRKAFEVTLHAATAAALLIGLRSEVTDFVVNVRPRLVALVGLASAPAAIAGLALERPIERRLGGPGTVAIGLIGGGLAMAWADTAPQARSSQDARIADAVWLGLAQASALFPGVSRTGATITAARARGFTRGDAVRLSRHTALPVIAGASILKLARLRRRGLPARLGVPFAAGATAAFVSTLGSTWLIGQLERNRSLMPYALYRLVLGGAVIQQLTARRKTIGS